MTLTDRISAGHPIELSDPVNLRDLGGIHTASGPIRSGFAIRTDDLAIVTDAYAETLVADGLRAVIDLRSPDEVAFTGRGPLGAHASVNYHHIPFLADIGTAADEGQFDQRGFGRMYVRMVEAAAPQIVTALATIAFSPGTVAFHCAAGQDRTGVLAAALLLALGTDTEDIVADYLETGPNTTAIAQRVAPMIAPLMAKLGLDLDGAATAALRWEFSDVPMRALLDELGRHDDPLQPLRDAGLTDGVITRLRERAVGAIAA